MRLVARNLRVLHSRFEQLEALARVGLEIDPAIELEIAQGRILRALLRQGQGSPRGIADQTMALLALNEGWLDRVPPAEAPRAVARLLDRAREHLPAIVATLDRGRIPDGEWQASLKGVAAPGEGS